MNFNKNVLLVDAQACADQICAFIREQLVALKRDGAVIGLSGGVDSALCASLCVRAVGGERVLGLILPERESSPVSEEYARLECDRLGLRYQVEDISGALEALGCYALKDSAIAEIFPDYQPGSRSKIALPGSLLDKDTFNFYTLTVEDAKGETKVARLNNRVLRQIVSANNLKQRTRMLYLYRFAEARNYLVCGTTNRSENVQGFFVKYGDGGVDIEPIANLYKTQVYQLAEFVGVSDRIVSRAPTPDTFGLMVTDEEFYFRVPYAKLDLLLFAWENRVSVEEVRQVLDLDQGQIERVLRDIASKYNLTKHLRAIAPSPEVVAPTAPL